ncbi:SEC-C metal-binding domain-containing protein [Proteiniclasticum sp. C24MP]|uniref:YecA family protein n=1 Tax=Proteiniclasticum sp. C24MP TaxID=3374101 RepID=UPI0037543B96
MGVDEYWNVMTRISDLTGEKVDPMEYSAVIGEAAGYYGEIEKSGALIFRKDVLNLSKVMMEQNKRKDVPPYPFTKAKLRKAGKPGYIDKSPEMSAFLQTIRDAYATTSSQAEEIGREVIRIINQTGDPTQVMKHLEKRLVIPDSSWFQMISKLVMDLYNHASQWELRGYAPVELSGKKKETGNSFSVHFPVSSVPVMGSKEKHKNSKTGRNDPCPCGSGKKHKNCCERKIKEINSNQVQ